MKGLIIMYAQKRLLNLIICSMISFGLIVVAHPNSCFSQWETRGLNYEIEMGEAVNGNPFGAMITDFEKAKIRAETFAELQKELDDPKKCEALLEKFKSGKDCLGLAVYLNQRFPDQKFAPITHQPVQILDNTLICIDFWINGEKTLVNVTSSTFGLIMYDYWRSRLLNEDDEAP